MKNFLIGLLLIIAANETNAQDIQVTRFERNYTSLIASTNPVYDNTGEACAVIRIFVRDDGFIIEPNMGMMKQETKPGEIRMWVPKGTKRLTIRNSNWMPLIGCAGGRKGSLRRKKGEQSEPSRRRQSKLAPVRFPGFETP